MPLLIVIILALFGYMYFTNSGFYDVWGVLGSFDFTSMIGVILYWIPMVFCAVGYVILTSYWYQKDFKNRAEARASTVDTMIGYTPSLTLGDLIWRVFLTLCPLVNIGAACFHVFPDLFEDFYKWLKKVFNQPLVPVRKD